MICSKMLKLDFCLIIGLCRNRDDTMCVGAILLFLKNIDFHKTCRTFRASYIMKPLKKGR